MNILHKCDSYVLQDIGPNPAIRSVSVEHGGYYRSTERPIGSDRCLGIPILEWLQVIYKEVRLVGLAEDHRFVSSGRYQHQSGESPPDSSLCRSLGSYQVSKATSRGISSRKVSKARYPGHVWSYDFIIERTEDGKTLKITDDSGRIQPGCPNAVVRAFSDWTSRHQDAGDVVPRLGSNGLLA